MKTVFSTPMKMALITTTIHTPHTLKLLRAYGPDVAFYVAGDRKSPDDECQEVASEAKAAYLPAVGQKRWGCSEAIGWNCIQRRNIALLEAVENGAEAIVTWDTDNLPTDSDYFLRFCQALQHPESTLPGWNGLEISSSTGWHNQYGPELRHRGFPLGKQGTDRIGPATGVYVGVAAGLCIGNPDVDATTRITEERFVHDVRGPASAGYVLAAGTRCVFNSQNTAFIRKFAPCFFMAPGIGRGDDITASLLAQHCMAKEGYRVHIGPPFAWQERHPHNLLDDLKAELWTMENIPEVARWLDTSAIDGSVLDKCRLFYALCPVFPEHTRRAAEAFYDDLEKVLFADYPDPQHLVGPVICVR